MPDDTTQDEPPLYEVLKGIGESLKSLVEVFTKPFGVVETPKTAIPFDPQAIGIPIWPLDLTRMIPAPLTIPETQPDASGSLRAAGERVELMRQMASLIQRSLAERGEDDELVDEWLVIRRKLKERGIHTSNVLNLEPAGPTSRVAARRLAGDAVKLISDIWDNEGEMGKNHIARFKSIRSRARNMHIGTDNNPVDHG